MYHLHDIHIIICVEVRIMRFLHAILIRHRKLYVCLELLAGMERTNSKNY